jgi:hypothetical protein
MNLPYPRISVRQMTESKYSVLIVLDDVRLTSIGWYTNVLAAEEIALHHGLNLGLPVFNLLGQQVQP